MENGTEIPGLERTACVTYEQRVPEGALPGAELRAEDLLDISELCKLITQRPDGEAIAHKACPSWRKQAAAYRRACRKGFPCERVRGAVRCVLTPRIHFAGSWCGWHQPEGFVGHPAMPCVLLSFRHRAAKQQHEGGLGVLYPQGF